MELTHSELLAAANALLAAAGVGARLELDERCSGHMGATYHWLVCKADGVTVGEACLGVEECPGEWGRE